jgi:hypothetical protein
MLGCSIVGGFVDLVNEFNTLCKFVLYAIICFHIRMVL